MQESNMCSVGHSPVNISMIKKIIHTSSLNIAYNFKDMSVLLR